MAMFKAIVVVMLMLAAEASASEAQRQTDAASAERIRAALLAAQGSVLAELTQPTIKLRDGLSLVPPDQAQGQVIQLKIPIGELAVKAARSFAVARRERMERKAHEEVTKALQDFFQQRSPQ